MCKVDGLIAHQLASGLHKQNFDSILVKVVSSHKSYAALSCVRMQDENIVVSDFTILTCNVWILQ